MILIRFYCDGIMLFEITDENVWSKALKDTIGLEEFHKQNLANYMWGNRVEAVVYKSKDVKIAKATRKLVAKRAKKGTSIDAIRAEVNESSQLNLQTEKGSFSKGDNETVDGVKQPEFGKVVLTTNIEETVNEAVAYDEFVLERDLTEREMVFNAMRAYCKVQGERKKSNDLPPPRVALYVSGAFAVHYALVDTGSTLCLCDAQLIHKLLRESASLRAAHHLVPLKDFKLQLGDGNTNMSVVGKMLIPFHLKTSEGKEVAIQQWFYMTTGLPDCWVIGDSLFKDQRIHKADISQHYRTLSFNKHVVPYVEMEPHFHCYMETEEVIPANATIVCLLRAANGTMKKRYVGVLSDRIDHQKLSILENVTRIWEKGHVRVSIHNKSKRTVTLKKGQSVACFQVTENLPDVDDEKLRTFTEQTENEGDDVFKVFARQHTELPSSSTILKLHASK